MTISFRLQVRGVAQVVAVAVAALQLAGATASAQTTLTVSPDVVAPGGSVTATVTGPPGQYFAAIGSSVNAGMSYGEVALAVGTDVFIIATGVLDGSGTATVNVVPPFQGAVLDRYYLQAASSPSPPSSPWRCRRGRWCATRTWWPA